MTEGGKKKSLCIIGSKAKPPARLQNPSELFVSPVLSSDSLRVERGIVLIFAVSAQLVGASSSRRKQRRSRKQVKVCMLAC